MRKLLFLGLLPLINLVSVGQPLIPKDATNAFLVFRRGDGIDTYYKIHNVRVFIDEATIGRIIEANSGIELVGFAPTQQISPNIYDFLPRIENIPAPQPPSVEPSYPPLSNEAPAGMVRLQIDGYEGVSDIFLADETLKVKNDNRLNVQLAIHSISLGENIGDKRSKVDYEITDLSGKVWVRVIQKEASIESRLGGSYGNNHPDKQYLSGLKEDCNIYLPINRTYQIKVLSKGNMIVDFWIHHPWSEDGHEQRMYRTDLGIHQQDIYTLHTAELREMPPYKRAIKINMNGKL
ncbi:hypothetical protein [Emticicia sp. C21]|uniref:hypothetical protein n=1 Tax=Emticicia sp. C21 TaxID=2302915 RepID=UPI000E355BAA|nr:hypothetical protein [Emticicia sp. C21]RFS16994.1 hypothetical protein D0T08_09970 [Emticicia sp. C21]